MRRMASQPRAHWQRRIEAAGLVWHSGEQPYWNEAACYELTAKDVETLESATNEIERLTLAAVEHLIENRLYGALKIPPLAVPLIETSWYAEPPSLYGRFDLAYDAASPPKLLEYNADTPTSLLEAAVVQWQWLEDVFPAHDQFNSIHERIIAQWKEFAPLIRGGHIDFCSMDDREDGMTVTYLQDTAQQAGLNARCFAIEEIGWNGADFVGPDDAPLHTVFKLYPWEWMVREEFACFLQRASAVWIEPAWQMLLSNKAILPLLWELFPAHPNLLEAHLDAPGSLESWVRKPLLGREGANVTMHRAEGEIHTSGAYGEEGFVYQDVAPIRSFDGRYPVIGSWLIGHDPGNAAAGIGIRESETPITNNLSQFVPHLFN